MTSIRGFLRSPRTIIGTIAAVTVLSAIGASLPQIGSATSAEMALLQGRGALVDALVRIFSLDHIFRSGWFLAPVLLAALSLSIVVTEQIRRLRVVWTQPLTAAHFQFAPYRAEFDRPARATAPGARIWSERRIGLAGSLVFHTGLLCIMVAGALRALFAADAAVDVLEGETVAATPGAWESQVTGLIPRPFSLDRPITLQEVRTAFYANGDLRDLSLRLDVQGAGEQDLAVNRELRTAGGRLFLGQDFGPAALLEWSRPGAVPQRWRVLLADAGRGHFEGRLAGPDDARAYLRIRLGTDGKPASALELRVVRGPALLAAAEVAPGQAVILPDGAVLTLRGLPFWARLRGSHDPALGLALAGLLLVLLGVSLVFLVIKVDACVVVTPDGDRERVFVALRPQRFAALYQERFRELVRQQGDAA